MLNSTSNTLLNSITNEILRIYSGVRAVSYHSSGRVAVVESLKFLGDPHNLKVGITVPMCAGVVQELLDYGVELVYFDVDLSSFSPMIRGREDEVRELDAFIVTMYFGSPCQNIDDIQCENIILNQSQSFSWTDHIPKKTKKIILSFQFNKFLKTAGGGAILSFNEEDQKQKIDYSFFNCLRSLSTYLVNILCRKFPRGFYWIKKQRSHYNRFSGRKDSLNIDLFKAFVLYSQLSFKKVQSEKSKLRESHELLNNSFFTTYYLIYVHNKEKFIQHSIKKGIFTYYWPEEILTPRDEISPDFEISSLSKYKNAAYISDHLVCVSLLDSDIKKVKQLLIDQEQSIIQVLSIK